MELGGLLWTNVLKFVLPPQRHSPDTWLEHQESFIHPAQNKSEKERDKKERKKEDKVKKNKKVVNIKNIKKKMFLCKKIKKKKENRQAEP